MVRTTTVDVNLSSYPILPTITSDPHNPSPMATASSSWMPAAGRHNVSIGSSLSKALKARKGQPPTQRNKALPERDFYALRCACHIFPPLLCPAPRSLCIIKHLRSPRADNHKPPSIDPTKPGTLEVNPGREVTSVRVERPTVNVRFRSPPHPTHPHFPLLPNPLTPSLIREFCICIEQ